MKKLTVLVPILALITAIVMSCGEEPRHRGITDENQRTHVDSVIFSAFDTRDIPRGVSFTVPSLIIPVASIESR